MTKIAATLFAVFMISCVYSPDIQPEQPNTGMSIPGSNDQVVAIEEDWELVVGDVDAALAAPQIVTYMEPRSPEDPITFCFMLNYRTLPNEDLGGLQLQAWRTETNCKYKTLMPDTLLNLDNEVITWTQRVEAQGGHMTFIIRNFSSVSFGDMASDDELLLQIVTGANTFHMYSPQHSIERSGATFAANRVNSMKLLKVRYYRANGAVQEVVVDQVVRSGS